MRCGDFHGFVDGAGAHVQSAAEDIGEAQHIVDLVGIIAAARRHDDIAAHGQRIFGRDFRIGIGHGKDDRVRRHAAQHVAGQRPLGGKTQEHVTAHHGVGQSAGLGFGGMGGLPLVHAFGAAAIDHALGVAEQDIFALHAHGLQQLQTGDAGRTGAVHHHLDVFQLATRQMRGIDDAGGTDDGGAMLVVMEHRNVHQLAQLLLDDEAVGGLDVFQVHAAEAGRQIADGIDEFVHILGVHAQVNGVHIGKALEQHRLAFHHRLGGQGPQVTQPQDGSAVGDHGHHVALGGIVVGQLRVLGDRQHRHGHAGRIGQAQVALGGHRLGGIDLELAGLGAGMERQGFLFGEGRTGHLFS